MVYGHSIMQCLRQKVKTLPRFGMIVFANKVHIAQRVSFKRIKVLSQMNQRLEIVSYRSAIPRTAL